MKIAFFIYGLTKRNTHLMPWRYVLEVANHLNALGHRTIVLTDNCQGRTMDWSKGDAQVTPISGSALRSKKKFAALIDEMSLDVLYFPFSKRSSISGGIPNLTNTPVIAYFPSAWYKPGLIGPVLRKLPLREAAVYATESLIPGSLLVRTLKRKKVLGIAAITDFTAEHLIAGGWPEHRIRVLLPGIDLSTNKGTTSKVFQEYAQRLTGKKCFLFMGPAKAIRGIFCLLKAFDISADSADDILLTCILRRDSEPGSNKLAASFNKLRNKERVLLIEDQLNKNDVTAFVKASYALVLPFLLVPSEIPLAVLEAMSLGKPVLITETGGTSQFVGNAGLVVRPDNIGSLAQGILRIASDSVLYKKMENKAQSKINAHPDWRRLAEEYVQFAEAIL
ncbi:MAG: glycosyltransferase family 4 protein [Deltaproteobacteria bacterium]|jgi:glycosyltransferase involved in cell wall biosynthesis|nr:glycosyltransferase family 4 protein [Deltaproteobacteria bacterium]